MNRLFPTAPGGDFDEYITWFCLPVIEGDEIKLYYGGATYPHSKPIVGKAGPESLAGGPRPNMVGLATLPLDRFIGLRSDEPWGAFLTRPFVVDGDELIVNANVDRELRVEIVDPVTRLEDSGRKSHIGHYIAGVEHRFPGFERGYCPIISGDNIRHAVKWKGGSIGRFKGKPVRLRFISRMATVYSFKMMVRAIK